MEIGIRELKAHLSEYLGRVERGEVISVSRRGKPVAQIAPLPSRGRIEQGIAEGWIRPGNGEPPTQVVPGRPEPGTPTTTELIRQDRDA